MKKILLLCSILLIIASCNNSEQVVEIEELEKEYIEKLNRAEDFGESQISQLSAHVNKLEKENTELKNEVHELEFYKHLNFQEMKLVHEYLNPDNSEKNIYVYTNSYNSSQVNNIKEVENCASIRHRDNDAYDCFIFI